MCNKFTNFETTLYSRNDNRNIFFKIHLRQGYHVIIKTYYVQGSIQSAI